MTARKLTNEQVEKKYGVDKAARRQEWLGSLPPAERSEAILAEHLHRSEVTAAQKEGRPAPPRPAKIIPLQERADIAAKAMGYSDFSEMEKDTAEYSDTTSNAESNDDN